MDYNFRGFIINYAHAVHLSLAKIHFPRYHGYWFDVITFFTWIEAKLVVELKNQDKNMFVLDVRRDATLLFLKSLHSC